MAKRDNNYSRTTTRKDFKKQENVNETLDFLEKHGRLESSRVLMPREINKRCLIYYKEIQQCNNAIKSFSYDCLFSINDRELDEIKNIIKQLRNKKSTLNTKLINLCSIVISNVIKKFKTLRLYYDDVFTGCVVDILTMIDRDKYNPEKASFHSYIYEISYQQCIKYLDNKASQENNIVDLLQV